MGFDISAALTDHSKEIEDAFNEKLNLALQAVGGAAEANAKKEITQLHAVDTGRLRNSITFATIDHCEAFTYSDDIGNTYNDAPHGTPEKGDVYIGTNVEYAEYVEKGTSKMAARPYLLPAATQHGAEYKALMEAIFKK